MRVISVLVTPVALALVGATVCVGGWIVSKV